MSVIAKFNKIRSPLIHSISSKFSHEISWKSVRYKSHCSLRKEVCTQTHDNTVIAISYTIAPAAFIYRPPSTPAVGRSDVEDIVLNVDSERLWIGTGQNTSYRWELERKTSAAIYRSGQINTFSCCAWCTVQSCTRSEYFKILQRLNGLAMVLSSLQQQRLRYRKLEAWWMVCSLLWR